jgi:hypothetical protein
MAGSTLALGASKHCLLCSLAENRDPGQIQRLCKETQHNMFSGSCVKKNKNSTCHCLLICVSTSPSSGLVYNCVYSCTGFITVPLNQRKEKLSPSPYQSQSHNSKFRHVTEVVLKSVSGSTSHSHMLSP